MTQRVFLLVCCAILVPCCMESAVFPDWLLSKNSASTTLEKTSPNTISLTNGIIARTFAMKPDFFTLDYYSYEKKSSLLRAVGPEARIVLDGHVYDVGGVKSGIPRGYLNRSALAQDISASPGAFHFVKYSVSKPEVPYPYTPRRYAPKHLTWPPKGVRLEVLFQCPNASVFTHRFINVVVHYEMYDGIPLLVKWVQITPQNIVGTDVQASIVSVEYLALNQQWAEPSNRWFIVDSNFPHSADIMWAEDPAAADMPGSKQPVLNCTFNNYFSTPLFVSYEPQHLFESYKVHELVVASADRERQSLAYSRKLRLLAPQTQENPIYFHTTKADNSSVFKLLDQLADVGFEMLIFSFGSGFNMESENETYISEIRGQVAYAHSLGLEVGGYDLIAWTRSTDNPDWAVINSAGKPSGNSCMASKWYEYLLDHVLSFCAKTGISEIITDGPYGNDYQCFATNHTHHNNAADSRYWNTLYQGRFYTALREKNIYINQPDNYFYFGGNKATLGYNEHQFDLPRWQDLSVSRQGMYDDLYHMIPTAGWMFLPLVVYHGGGEAAEFEPLDQHPVEYDWALAQYFGAGVAITLRGYEPYDNNITKAIVKKWISFYKQYRDILTSDIIHIRRADMQSIDAFMHVNPFIKNKGLVMVFNPTDHKINFDLDIPLYYTGLTDSANISHEGITPKVYTLSRDFHITVSIALQPLGYTWYLIQ